MFTLAAADEGHSLQKQMCRTDGAIRPRTALRLLLCLRLRLRLTLRGNLLLAAARHAL